MSSSSRINSRDVGGSAYSQDAETPGSGGGSGGDGNAISIQGVPVDPAAPSVGEQLIFDGVQYTPSVPPGGGDVVGPASAVDNAIARFDGVSGKIIQDSLWSIDDFGDIFARTDANILPDADGSSQVGTPLIKFRSMHAYLFSTGDLELKHPTRERAHWLIEEYEDHLQVKHVPSGRTYELVLRRKGRCSRFRPQRIFRKMVHRVLARLRES